MTNPHPTNDNVAPPATASDTYYTSSFVQHVPPPIAFKFAAENASSLSHTNNLETVHAGQSSEETRSDNDPVSSDDSKYFSSSLSATATTTKMKTTVVEKATAVDEYFDQDIQHDLLFESWDHSWKAEEDFIKICFVTFLIFQKSITENRNDEKEYQFPVIPAIITHSFWKEVLQEDIDIQVVTDVLVEKFPFLHYKSVSFQEEEVQCLQLSRDVYHKYGNHVFTDLHQSNMLQNFGESKLEINRKWHDILVKVLEGDDNLFQYYRMIALPHHTFAVSREKAEDLMCSSSFASHRVRTLGVLSATLAHISDCGEIASQSKDTDILLKAYDCIYSQYPVSASLEERVDIARALLSLSNSLYRSNKESVKYYEKALLGFEDLSEENVKGALRDVFEMDMAEALHCLGNHFVDTDRQKSMDYYHRSLRIRHSLLGSHHPLLSDTLHSIGVLHSNSNNYKMSLKFFQECLRIRYLVSEEFPSESLDLSIADTLEWIGQVCKELKEYSKSIESFKEAITIRRLVDGKESEDVATLCHDMASVYDDLKDYEKSLIQYGESLRIRRVCLDRVEDSANASDRVVETLCCMGSIYRARENWVYALECFREAMDLQVKCLRENMEWIRELEMVDDARILPLPIHQGGIHKVIIPTGGLKQNDTSSGETLENEKELELLRIMAHVVDLTIVIHGKNHFLLSEVFYSMAEIYVKIGSYNKAIKCLEEVCRIRSLLMLSHETKSAVAMYRLGLCHARIGKLDKAIDYYQESLSIRHCGHSQETSRDVADIWYNVGNIQSALGSHHDALCSLLTALRMRELIYQNSQDHIEIINAEYCVGTVHTYLDECDKARSILEHTFSILKERFGEQHIFAAHGLYHLGQVYRSIGIKSVSTGIVNHALENFKKSLSIYQKHLSSNHIIIGHIYYSIGTIHDIRGEYSDAVELLKEALKVYKLYEKGEHAGVAMVLNHLGVVCACVGKDFYSLNYFQKALSMRKMLMGEDHPCVADSLHNIGGVFTKLGRLHEAVGCFEYALKIRMEKHGQEDLLVAKTLNNLGIVHARLEQYSLATVKLIQALQILQKHLSPENEEVASTLYNIGNVRARSGKYDLAVKYFEESMRIRRLLFGDNHPTIGNMMHNLGALYEDQKKYDHAKKCYEESLRVKRLLLEPDEISIAKILCKIGNVQANLRECDSALVCYDKALKMQKKHLGPDHLVVSQTFLRIGNLHKITGTHDSALMCFEEALRIREESLGEKHEDVASALYLLGSVYDMKGQYEDAMIHYGNAYRIFNNQKHQADRYRQHVIHALRKIVLTSGNKAGFCDTFIITGDFWLSLERMILDLVNLLPLRITEPMRKMIRNNIMILLKNAKMARNHATVTCQDLEKYQATLYDPSCLVEG